MIFLNQYWTKYLELLEFNSVKYIQTIKKFITTIASSIKFKNNILKFKHHTKFAK
jgi:hypothetical protein